MAVQDPMKWFRRQASPVTFVLTGIVIIGALLSWAMPGFMLSTFGFDGHLIPKVWTILTYPFAESVLLSGGSGPIFAIFLALWLLGIGRNLEPDHGSRNFLLLWIGCTLVGVIPLAIFGYYAMGTLIPVAMLSVIWGTRFKDATVMLFGIVPILGKWIAVISVLSVFFSYAVTGSMIFAGILACVGCGVAYPYAANKIPFLPYGFRRASNAYVKAKPTKAQLKREKEYYDDVYRREKERDERERLRKLFEDSLGDEK
ncbi:MAG: hypothetical protein JST51_14830 [Armatimonadetes bacterium]|nr:hypothetical protein [Armatimonadota bacterium]